MGQAFWQENKTSRSSSEGFFCTFDLKFPFKDIERFVLEVVNVSWRPSMRRHGPFGESEVAFGIFTTGLVRERNAIHVHLLAFTQREYFGLTLDLS
jgi:hypothetical protein